MGLDIYFNRTKSEQVGYFRKVNFLVGFFSEITNREIENLTPVKINKDDCLELLYRCDEVLKDHSKAEELLPTYPGFFFGNYEYDEYYFKDVQQVKSYLECELLPLFDDIEDSDDTIEFEIWY